MIPSCISRLRPSRLRPATRGCIPARNGPYEDQTSGLTVAQEGSRKRKRKRKGLLRRGSYSRVCSHFKQPSACARSWRRNEAAACANMPACCRRCRRYSVTMRCCAQGCERYSLTTMGAAARRLVASPPSAAGPSVGATQNGAQPAWQVASLWLDCFPKPSSPLCLCERARSTRALEAWDAA